MSNKLFLLLFLIIYSTNSEVIKLNSVRKILKEANDTSVTFEGLKVNHHQFFEINLQEGNFYEGYPIYDIKQIKQNLKTLKPEKYSIKSYSLSEYKNAEKLALSEEELSEEDFMKFNPKGKTISCIKGRGRINFSTSIYIPLGRYKKILQNPQHKNLIFDIS